MKKSQKLIEYIFKIIFLMCGFTTVVFVISATVFLIAKGIPAMKQIGFFDFISGKTWRPVSKNPEFGILPFILTSIYLTVGSTAIGTPIGILASVWMSKSAPPHARRIGETASSFLAGVPSVVFGLLGMTVLVPAIRKSFGLSDGACLFTSIIVLAVMILPSVIKLSLPALDSVPPECEASSLALGATPEETFFRISIPAAKSGIAAASALGAGRAAGEAMAVIMVSGNAPNMPRLFESVRPLTSAVASETAYAAGLHRQALFSCALILFFIIVIINGAARALLNTKK